MELLLVGLIVFAAMVIRGFTGFGGALLMVPLLGLVWDVRLAIVVVACIQLATGGMLVGMARRSVNWQVLRPVVVVGLIGLAAGSYLLARLPVEWIARIVGVVSIVLGLVSLARRVGIAQDAARPAMAITATVGLTAGLLHGLVGTSGPVMVPYLQRVLPSPAVMRATLLSYFFLLDILRIGGYLQLGIIDGTVLRWGLLLIPIAVIGSIAGARIHVQVSDNVFRIAVASLLVVAGALLLI